MGGRVTHAYVKSCLWCVQADDGWSAEGGWGEEAVLPLAEEVEEAAEEEQHHQQHVSVPTADLAAEREADIGK